MKSFDTKGAATVVRLEQFLGLCRFPGAKRVASADTLCNLRCRTDGSLSRRDGVRPLITLPYSLRGAFADERGDHPILYAVADRYIYAVKKNASGQYAAEAIGETETTSGDVSFFWVEDALILSDGTSMYRLQQDAAQVMIPYVPLYGDGWTANDYGTVAQERNALTDRVHIRYVTSSSSYSMALHIQAQEINAVYKNGTLLQATTDYTVNSSSNTINWVSLVRENVQIDVIMTLPADEEVTAIRQDFYTCRCAVRQGEANRSVMLFAGGKECGVVYLTEQIAPSDRVRCRTWEPDATMLYLQKGGRMEIGDGVHGVYAMTRHDDRTLLMTSQGTWTTDEAKLGARELQNPFRAVNSTIGCSCTDGALTVRNQPFSLCHGHLYAWKSDTDELDECNASSVSTEVFGMIPSDLLCGGRLFYHAEKDEIWVYHPSVAGDVWVYQLEVGEWTRFDFGEAAPISVASWNGTVILCHGKTIFQSDASALCDESVSGTASPISCEYSSHFLPIAHEGKRLHPYAAMLCICADTGQTVRVQALLPSGRMGQMIVTATGETPCEAVTPLYCGRCAHLKIRVVCECIGPLEIHAVAIAATK